MRAMAFLGANLYVATDQGLAVIHNVGACIGNLGGCGNAVPVQDGFSGAIHIGIATHGAGKLYFSVNGGRGISLHTGRPARGSGVNGLRLCRRAHECTYARRVREFVDWGRSNRRIV